MRSISVLGATGSIGASTLDLIRRQPGQWRVVALTANGNAAALASLAREFAAEIAVVADEAALPALREALAGTGIAAAGGEAALIEAIAHKIADIAVLAFAAFAKTMTLYRSVVEGVASAKTILALVTGRAAAATAVEIRRSSPGIFTSTGWSEVPVPVK